jgi:hypothetical protein
VTPPEEPSQWRRDQRVLQLSLVRSWAAVFGAVQLAELDAFDLVVAGGTSPAGQTYLSLSQSLAMQQAGTLVVAHLQLATVTPQRDGRVPVSWLLGSVDAESTSRGVVPYSFSARMHFVDPRHAGWQEAVVGKARAVAATGLDGLYLDDLDVGQASPERQYALWELVALVRSATPDLLLIAQRGQGVPAESPVDGFGREEPFLRAAVRPTGIPLSHEQAVGAHSFHQAEGRPKIEDRPM